MNHVVSSLRSRESARLAYRFSTRSNWILLCLRTDTVQGISISVEKNELSTRFSLRALVFRQPASRNRQDVDPVINPVSAAAYNGYRIGTHCRKFYPTVEMQIGQS